MARPQLAGRQIIVVGANGHRASSLSGGTVRHALDGQNVLVETDGSLVTQAVYAHLPGM